MRCDPAFSHVWLAKSASSHLHHFHRDSLPRILVFINAGSNHVCSPKLCLNHQPAIAFENEIQALEQFHLLPLLVAGEYLHAMKVQ